MHLNFKKAVCLGYIKIHLIFVLFIQNIASHIIKLHASANAVTGDTKTSKEDNWLKRCTALFFFIFYYICTSYLVESNLVANLEVQ